MPLAREDSLAEVPFHIVKKIKKGSFRSFVVGGVVAGGSGKKEKGRGPEGQSRKKRYEKKNSKH